MSRVYASQYTSAISPASSARERGWRRQSELVGVRPFEIERPRRERVDELRRSAHRNLLEVFRVLALHRCEELVVRAGVDLAEIVVRKALCVAPDAVRVTLLVAVRLECRMRRELVDERSLDAHVVGRLGALPRFLGRAAEEAVLHERDLAGLGTRGAQHLDGGGGGRGAAHAQKEPTAVFLPGLAERVHGMRLHLRYVGPGCSDVRRAVRLSSYPRSNRDWTSVEILALPGESLRCDDVG